MNLQLWNYDPSQENMLIHAGDCFADPSPLEAGKFLIPAHATPVPAMPDQPGKTQHFDAVSSVWYFKDLPTDPPPPAPVTLTEDEKKKIEISALNSQLQQNLDSLTMQYAKALLQNGSSEAAKVTAIRVQQTSLKAQYSIDYMAIINKYNALQPM